VNGQASLPFSYDGGKPTGVTGLTHIGLGTDYSSSPKMKFDSAGDNLILNFTGSPGTLSFNIKWNQSTSATRFPGDFELLESADGISYTRVQLYDATTGTALPNGTVVSESFTTLNSATRYLKWNYTTKTNGNIALGLISLSAVSGTPVITVDPNTLTNFSYLQGAGPSASQSYSLSGSNLTGSPGNITINAPTDYEVSTDNSNFGASKTVAYTTATLAATTIWVRLKAGLSAGTYNSELIINAGGGASTVNVTCSGTVYKPEPTNHVTSFSSAAGTPNYSAITVTWTDATGTTLPDGYLIKASSVGYGNITAPVDGTAESDALLIKNIAQGVQTASFTGLSPATTYYFQIYPYTNSGTAINFKTDGTVPQTSVATDAAPVLPNAWINEIHYDNASTDANEFVEIIIENPSLYTLSNFSVVLYNGNGGAVYDTKTIDAFTTGTTYEEGGKTFTVYSYTYPVDGIQNGAPDGVALSYSGSLIQFLSYEGTFTATSGPAVGVLSTDIVVTEGVDLAGGSVGLTGSGTTYSEFAWTTFAIHSKGLKNADQALPVELTSFTAKVIGGKVNLNWSTATEVNNFGFEIERSLSSHSSSLNGHSLPNTWEVVGFVSGAGNSNSVKEYSYTDLSLNLDLNLNLRYRLKQIDNDGSFAYSKEVEVLNSKPSTYQLSQNFPNPFNPSTVISYQLPVSSQVSLKVYDVLGNEVASLVNLQQEAGSYNVTLDASTLASGTYIYRLIAGDFVSTKKLVVLK